MTIKDLKYVKVNSLNPLFLIFNKVNRCYEEINKSNSSTLVATNESEEKTKKYKNCGVKLEI